MTHRCCTFAFATGTATAETSSTTSSTAILGGRGVLCRCWLMDGPSGRYC